MTADHKEVMHRINWLTSELDSIYHSAALKLGMPDSVMRVLYIVYWRGGRCLLGDIRREAGMSKQTLNSALRRLEGEGIIYLEASGGRGKTVCLTEKGGEYAERTAGRLFAAECAAFDGWTAEEIGQYLRLSERFNGDLRRQIEKI